MSLDSLIEKRIREAMVRGEFDNLPGKGKRLDLDAYFNTPEDLRAAFSILKSNNFVPEEVELLQEISVLKDELKSSTTCTDKESLVRRINEKSLALRLILEKHKRKIR